MIIAKMTTECGDLACQDIVDALELDLYSGCDEASVIQDDLVAARDALKDLKFTRKEQLCVAKCRIGGGDLATCQADCA